MRILHRNMLIWAGGLLFGFAGYNTALRAEPPASMPAGTALPVLLQYMLFLLIVLVGIFLISSFAFLRWSKTFRRRIFREPSAPTPAEDVWAMHRLPEEPDDSGPAGPSNKQDDDEEPS